VAGDISLVDGFDGAAGRCLLSPPSSRSEATAPSTALFSIVGGGLPALLPYPDPQGIVL